MRDWGVHSVIGRVRREAGTAAAGAAGVILLAITLTGCRDGMTFSPGSIEFRGVEGSGEPNLMVTSSGDVVLSWHEVTDGTKSLLFAVRSQGMWSEPRVIATGLPFFVNWADLPSLVEFADGTWGVHWLQKQVDEVFSYDVKIALSRDRGITWGDPFSPHHDGTHSEHGFVSLTRFGGELAALWLDGRLTDSDPPGPMSLWFARPGPNGQIGTELLVDDRVCDCCNTAMTAIRDGLVIAYRDRSPAEVRDIAVRKYSGGSFSDPYHVGDDNWVYPGCPVNGPALTSAGDEVALAWYTAPDQRPRVNAAFSNDGGSTFGPVVRVDEGATLGRVDIEFIREGLALVTWVEFEGDRGFLRARTIAPDGSTGAVWAIADIDPSRESGFPRLAVSGNELVFAWTEPGSGGGVRVSAARIE